MAPKVSKKWLPNFMFFFTFVAFPHIFEPSDGSFFSRCPSKIGVFAFSHVFEKWLKNAFKNHKKL